jgi:4-amino-4-deoxy-L-arabinose transferase-like glycosyltransferase
MAGDATRRLPAGVWLCSAGAVALLLAVSARYGFHRDELYFIVAGRRLDWGYVDQPPFTPLIARISETVLGTSPTAIRVLPAISVGVVAVLAAAMARTFGGGRRAQVLAAFMAGGTGVLLGEGHLLSTAVFDYLFWAVGLWIVTKILDGADPRWWLALGLVVGIGLENKHTMAFFAVALLLGLLVTKQRRLLASPYPWIGAAVAFVIALPNVVWQATNGWPQLEMAEALRARSDGPLAFLVLQPALLSITLAVPAFAGLWWLARSDRAVPWRPVAAAYAILFVFFLATGAKAYYIAPMYAALLAAGAVWMEGLAVVGRRWMEAVLVLGMSAGLFIALPLLPVTVVGAVDLTGELGETVGWPSLIDDVGAAYELVPASDRAEAVVYTASYGEAGAVDVLGPEAGLPAAASGHNNYWLWGPPPHHGPIIVVGPVGDALAEICPGLTEVGVLGNPYGVENEVVGRPLLLCLEPTGQLSQIWDRLRHYS